MKYWEVVADKLSAAGWTWSYCSAVTRDGWRWIVDVHCGDASRTSSMSRLPQPQPIHSKQFMANLAGRNWQFATSTYWAPGWVYFSDYRLFRLSLPGLMQRRTCCVRSLAMSKTPTAPIHGV